MIQTPPDTASWFRFTPDDDPLPLLLEFLRDAKESIRVIAYGFTLPEVVDELIAAHKRGVRVRLILDSSQAGGKAAKVQVNRLLAAGVPLVTGRSSRGGIIHLKTAIIDSHLIWGGSWNWSRSATSQLNNVLALSLPGQLGGARHVALFEREWKRLTGKKPARKKAG